MIRIVCSTAGGSAPAGAVRAGAGPGLTNRNRGQRRGCGQATSLALNGSGWPHISYTGLKYAIEAISTEGDPQLGGRVS